MIGQCLLANISLVFRQCRLILPTTPAFYEYVACCRSTLSSPARASASKSLIFEKLPQHISVSISLSGCCVGVVMDKQSVEVAVLHYLVFVAVLMICCQCISWISFIAAFSCVLCDVLRVVADSP
jgi:hypothetical protein